MEELKESARSAWSVVWYGFGLLKFALVLMSLVVQGLCVVLFWWGLVTEGLETGTIQPTTCLGVGIFTFIALVVFYAVGGYVKAVFASFRKDQGE